MSAQHKQRQPVDDLLSRLRKPCGKVTGHGENCIAGRECGACSEKSKAADVIEQQRRKIGSILVLLQAVLDDADAFARTVVALGAGATVTESPNLARIRAYLKGNK